MKINAYTACLAAALHQKRGVNRFQNAEASCSRARLAKTIGWFEFRPWDLIDLAASPSMAAQNQGIQK